MRRLAVPSALARLAYVLPLILSAGCAGRGISLSTNNHPQDPALLLSCARAVATDQGLGVVTQSSDAFEIQAKSSVDTPTRDVLTVTLSPAKKGFQMLVGGASYVVRQLRGGTGDAVRSEWVGTSPSHRVAVARDAVLTQCGSLGR
jgi:hypothetical protein